MFFKYTYSIVTQFLSDCHCLLLVALSGIEPWTFSSQPTFPAKSCIHYDFPPQHALYVCTSETFASGPFALSSKIAPILQILRTSASKTQFKDSTHLGSLPSSSQLPGFLHFDAKPFTPLIAVLHEYKFQPPDWCYNA